MIGNNSTSNSENNREFFYISLLVLIPSVFVCFAINLCYQARKQIKSYSMYEEL